MKEQKQRVSKLMQLGRYAEALKHCKKLCEMNKHDAESFYMLASIYGSLGQYKEASIQFEKVVKLEPTAVVAHDGLGMSHNMLGNFEAAKKAFEDALSLQPQNAQILTKLGFTLYQLGAFDDCEKQLQRALNLSPQSAEILDALGDLRYQKAQYHEAIKYYKRAIAKDNSRVDSHTYMGNSFLRLGKSDKAIPYFEHAITLDPDNLDVSIHLAHALKGVGESIRSMQYYQKALELEPANLIAAAGVIDVHEKSGDFDAAYKILQPLVQQPKVNADIASAYIRLCHRFDSCEDAIEVAEKALGSDELETNDRANLEYSLGRRFDRLRKFDQAFSHYVLANKLSPHSFDPVSHLAYVDALIKSFNAEFFIRTPRAKVRSNSPVFIVGMPRSGTSLVEQILASHPQVFGAGELNDISEAVLSLSKYPFDLNNLDSDVLDNFANSFLQHLSELDATSLRVTDKNPVNFFHLGLISLIFPDARVIHCTRDPRDTCLSIYFQGFSEAFSFANELEDIGFYYRQYERIMRHFKSLNCLPILDVSYENLVSNQEEETRKLIEFIELDWDEQCLQFHKNERFVATPSYDQVREKMYSSSVGRWKNYEAHLEPLYKALL
jgi:tetratricopeptide (TPR) repeat protein